MIDTEGSEAHLKAQDPVRVEVCPTTLLAYFRPLLACSQWCVCSSEFLLHKGALGHISAWPRHTLSTRIIP